MSTALMNPREYEDLLKKLRHIRAQETATEKTLTELRIEKAELIKEHIDRADKGQKMGIYEAAGVNQANVTKDLQVKELLTNYSTSNNLPSHSVLQEIANGKVPEAVREAVLANPDITVKEARAAIAAAKPPVPEYMKPRPSLDTMREKVGEMDAPSQRLLHGYLGSLLGAESSKHYATLGLSPSADPVVVKAAIRALQNKHHPDKGGDAAEFARIQEASEAINAA